MKVVRFAWTTFLFLLPACNAVFGIEERPAREKASATTGSGSGGADGCAPGDCFPPPPSEWSGPVLFGNGSGSNAAEPGCDGLDEVLRLDAEPMDATHTCPCECGPATGITCTVQVTSWHNPDCTAPLQNYSFASAGQCVEIHNDTEAVSFPAPVIDTAAASCLATAATPELPAPSFAERAVGCGPVDDLTTVPDGFDSCIYRSGDHACPDDDYTERSVWYAGVEDTRACLDDCSCGAITAQCDVVMLANGGHSCNESPDTPLPAAPGCATGFFDSAELIAITPSGSCEPGFATPTGAITPMDPTTVCCLRPPS